MLSAREAVDCLAEHGLGPFVGVPCSFLKPLINCLIDDEDGEYLGVNNEGEAVALASGAYLGGRSPVVMIQNSGLGNAVNPLTSLSHVFHIPVLLIVTLRGEVGANDEPQHRLMGQITEQLLGLMEIPCSYFPERSDELREHLETASEHMEARGNSYALIMRKGTLAPYALLSSVDRRGRTSSPAVRAEPPSGTRFLRREAIAAIVSAAGGEPLLVATTGGTARELCESHDRDANFYVVGSMGCASSIGLGLALCRPGRRVIVLDGDGAALMRLESMASIGHHAPRNLTHIILDNQSYESTGGQQTQSSSVDFPGLAIACGYRTVESSSTAQGLAESVARASRTVGPHLVHVRVAAGSAPDLGRPPLAPPALAERFRVACSQRVAAAGTYA